MFLCKWQGERMELEQAKDAVGGSHRDVQQELEILTAKEIRSLDLE